MVLTATRSAWRDAWERQPADPTELAVLQLAALANAA